MGKASGEAAKHLSSGLTNQLLYPVLLSFSPFHCPSLVCLAAGESNIYRKPRSTSGMVWSGPEGSARQGEGQLTPVGMPGSATGRGTLTRMQPSPCWPLTHGSLAGAGGGGVGGGGVISKGQGRPVSPMSFPTTSPPHSHLSLMVS